jgi:RHS repeat-associated protein
VSLTDGTNTFTAVATDTLGRWDTNTVTAYLPATVTFAYDLNGNLRTNGTRLLDYDDENQLIRVTEPGAWLSEFVYDGKMRRRLRREYVWQSAIWNLQSEIQYVYDGNLVIQERHYTPHLSTNHPQQTITYTRGNDLSGSLEGAGGIGGLLARTASEISNLQSPSHAYYHADGNGNVTAMIATNQAVVARYLYDPYGNPLAATGPLAEANLYRFSCKEWHPLSGLVYYGYRFYDPLLQRWLSRDLIGELGGLNLFAFAQNAPLDFVDLYGFNSIRPPGGIKPPWVTTYPPKPPIGILVQAIGAAVGSILSNECPPRCPTYQSCVNCCSVAFGIAAGTALGGAAFQCVAGGVWSGGVLCGFAVAVAAIELIAAYSDLTSCLDGCTTLPYK